MSIYVTYNELKKLSKDFFEAAKTATTLDSLDAGLKCFGIAWLNCTFPDTPLGKIQREVEHPVLLRIVNKVYMDNEMRILFPK